MLGPSSHCKLIMEKLKQGSETLAWCYFCIKFVLFSRFIDLFSDETIMFPKLETSSEIPPIYN